MLYPGLDLLARVFGFLRGACVHVFVSAGVHVHLY